MKRGYVWTFWVVVGLLVFAAMIPDGDGSDSSDNGGSDDPVETSADTGDEVGAKVMCERFVEDRLKAPSTATFSGWGDTEVGQTGEGRWEVAGWVDAENGFGAQIRSVYYCLLEYKGDQRWTAVEVVVE